MSVMPRRVPSAVPPAASRMFNRARSTNGMKPPRPAGRVACEPARGIRAPEGARGGGRRRERADSTRWHDLEARHAAGDQCHIGAAQARCVLAVIRALTLYLANRSTNFRRSRPWTVRRSPRCCVVGTCCSAPATRAAPSWSSALRDRRGRMYRCTSARWRMGPTRCASSRPTSRTACARYDSRISTRAASPCCGPCVSTTRTRARLAESVLRHIGSEYDLAHAWLLARSLLVRRWWARLRSVHAAMGRSATRFICSGLIAQAFALIGHSIVPAGADTIEDWEANQNLSRAGRLRACVAFRDRVAVIGRIQVAMALTPTCAACSPRGMLRCQLGVRITRRAIRGLRAQAGARDRAPSATPAVGPSCKSTVLWNRR